MSGASEPGTRASTSRAALITVLLLAAALRLPNLDDIPAGLIPDEALSAYDAFSLFETGRDSWGEPWPLFPKNTQRLHALNTYLVVPFVALRGLDEWAARLPAALGGIATVGILFALVGRTHGPRAGALAAALLAISPWHILLSRTGYDYNLLPLMTALAAWTLLRALHGGSWLLAGVTAGVALYTYAPIRLWLPLLLGGLLVLHRRELRQQWRWALPGAAALALLAAPVVAISLRPEGRERLASVMADVPAGAFLKQSTGRYFAALDPRFYLARASQGELHRMRSTGLVHLPEAALVLAGLVAAAVRRRRQDLLWAGWLVVAPLPVSIHRDCPDAVLLLTALPAVAALGGVGADAILDWAGCRLRWAVAALLAIAMAVSVGRMARDLYAEFPVYSAPAWTAGVKEAVEFCESVRAGYDDVLVDGKQKLLFSLIQFHARYEPARRQGELRASAGRNYRSQVGPYRIGSLDELLATPGRHLVWADREERRRLPPGRQPLRLVRWPDGRAAHVIYDAEGRP